MNKNIKENLNNIFITIFLFTLMFGDVAGQVHTNLLQVIYYFVGYLLAFALIDKKLKNKDFLSDKINTDKYYKDQINVSGVAVETESVKDVEEERFFRIIELNKMINLKLFILLYVVLLFFSIKAAPENFQTSSILPFVTAIFIALSATIGHLLIPLFFNALYFTINSRNTNSVLILSYVFLFLLTLIIFSQTFKEKIKPNDLNYSTLLRSLLSGFIPLIFCMASVHYFTNKPIDFLDFNKVNKINHQAGKLINKTSMNISLPGFPDKQDDFGIDLGNTPTLPNTMSSKNSRPNMPAMPNLPKLPIDKLPHLSMKMGQSNQIKNSKAASSKINETQDLLNKIEQSGQLTSEDMNKLSEQIKDLKLDMQLPKESDEGGKSDQLDTNTSLKNVEDSLEKMQTSPELNKEVLKNFQENLNHLSKAIENQEKTSNVSQNTSSPSPSSLSSPKEELAKPTPPTKKNSPLINEELLKLILKFLKTVIIVGMILFLLIFLNKFFNKTKYEDLERINPTSEDEAQLKIELNTLKNLKLNPRDEVIVYYEFIYKIIKFYHFPDQEAPPPTEACHQIVNKHLIIKKQLYTVDEIFSRCFYGNHEVTKDQLKLFRKSIPDILIRFGLKKNIFSIG